MTIIKIVYSQFKNKILQPFIIEVRPVEFKVSFANLRFDGRQSKRFL